MTSCDSNVTSLKVNKNIGADTLKLNTKFGARTLKLDIHVGAETLKLDTHVDRGKKGLKWRGWKTEPKTTNKNMTGSGRRVCKNQISLRGAWKSPTFNTTAI